LRRLLLLAVLFAFVPAAFAAWTTEVLVLASAPVTLSSVPDQRGLIIQNLGPNAIFCAMKAETPVVNKSLKIASGGSLTLWGANITLRCIAQTADQVTGAATIVSGVP
jgi:hypothetical protein